MSDLEERVARAIWDAMVNDEPPARADLELYGYIAGARAAIAEVQRDAEAEVERLREERGRCAVDLRAANRRIDALEAEVERLLTDREDARVEVERLREDRDESDRQWRFERDRARKAAEHLLPVGDVAAWLDEHYGTPDADRFLSAFARELEVGWRERD